jgi:hypothetical protein
MRRVDNDICVRRVVNRCDLAVADAKRRRDFTTGAGQLVVQEPQSAAGVRAS